MEEPKAKADAQFNALNQWAAKAKDEFAKSRSIEMRHGVIGFRKGKPRLELIGKTSWKDVLAKLKGKFAAYVRVKKEVNKEQMLADAIAEKQKIKIETLKRFGVKISQDDSFYIELKTENKPR